MLFSFYNHSQPLEVWADGISLNPRKWSLHVDIGRRVKASIRGKGNKGKKERAQTKKVQKKEE